MILPALSIRQPWAFAIINLGKDVENRVWRYPPRYRGPLLIHACKGLTANEYHESIALGMPLDVNIRAFPSFMDVARGGIVGACELHDIGAPLEVPDGWAQAGVVRLMLRKQIALPFRAYAGALGLFKVEITPEEEATLRTAGLIR